jgi:hypothetical protein
VNADQLRAFLYLRWRIRLNQMKRGGISNTIILGFLAFAATMFAVSTFIIAFFSGALALADVPAVVLLYVWDGIVVVFVFTWTIGLLAELQRSEGVTLDRFLHLPVSLLGAFFFNYLGSLVSLNLLLFLPLMMGLILGLVVGRGPMMLLLLPLAASLILMVTAVSYQFQGWLASLMVNKRRRRTVIVVATLVIVLISQTPNLIIHGHPAVRKVLFEHNNDKSETEKRIEEELTALDKSLQEHTITSQEYQVRRQEITRARADELKEQAEQTEHVLERTVRLLNQCLPPFGWLPLGASGLAEGNVLTALLGTLGMTLLGVASLWRSYRTTLRLYTRQSAPQRQRSTTATAPVAPATQPANMLEKQLPYLSEEASAVALGAFRAFTRAPEVKLLLIAPVVMVVIFGTLVLTHSFNPPTFARPFMPFGAMSMILLATSQVMVNQFGFDRGGFRIFVLSPADRRDILLGKNLAVAPLILGMGFTLAVIVEIVFPMRVDRFLALIPQFVSMFLLFCVLGNWSSMLCPIAIAPGSFKPANVKGSVILFQLFFMMVFPLLMLPMLLPMLVELALEALGWVSGLPIALALSVGLCVAVVFLYRLLLRDQGRLLLAREQKILATVTANAEG